MMPPYTLVDAAERNAASRTVRREQPVEGVACPLERQGVLDDHGEREIVDDEARILFHPLDEPRGVYLEPADFTEELNLEERHG
jgi:hypothetical protein